MKRIPIESFGSREREILDLVKGIASQEGLDPYLVGGPVRDALLGRAVRDLDLALEEGAETLAAALATATGGDLKAFPRFSTWRIETADTTIDVTACRTETYPAPGALPETSRGTIRDDLLRRDFTINALAARVRDDSILDAVEGLADLDARLLRILHPRSFIDDPTRGVRARRLESRLDLTLEAETEARLREAIASGAMDSVSRDRLARELRLAIREPDAARVLATVAHDGMLEPFGIEAGAPALDGDLELAARATAALPGLDPEVLFFGALAAWSAQSEGLLSAIGFDRRRSRIAKDIIVRGRELADELTALSDLRRRFERAASEPREILATAAATHPDLASEIGRIDEVANLPLPFRGDELGVPDGPWIAKAIARTRAAIFAGESPVDQALTFARTEALRYLKSDDS